MKNALIFYQILLTNSVRIWNRDQSGEFVCGCWGLSWVSSLKSQSFPFESLALKVLIFLLFDLQAALKQATEELQETQRVLAEAKARLAEVEEGIASLQAKYEECIAKKQELEFKTEQCSARLGRAEKVSLVEADA